MKQKQMIHELPDMVCLEHERRNSDDAIRKAVQELQSAYRSLSNIKELAPISTDLADITAEWIRDRTEKRMALVEQDMSMTEEERTARLASWQSIIARASRYIKTIERVVSEWQGASWVYDSQIENFYCTNIDDMVRAMSTHAVSDEAKEHYRLVWECIDKVRALRRWEDEHNVKSQLLADLQCMTAEAFAEMWVDGCVKFDTTTAEKYGFYIGNPHDPKHPARVII